MNLKTTQRLQILILVLVLALSVVMATHLYRSDIKRLIHRDQPGKEFIWDI